MSGVEAWRDIPGYEGIYRVSSEGRIHSLARSVRMPQGTLKQLPQQAIRTHPTRSGHINVVLCKSGTKRNHMVHRLLAEIFLADSWFPGAQVCHNDGNPANNGLSNLRWGTASDNSRDTVLHGAHWQTRKTHCPRNHAYDKVKVRTNGRRGRVCTICARESSRLGKQRRRARARLAAAS